MRCNGTNMYDIDAHAAESYDQTETYTHDVELVQDLMKTRGPLRILEPFCGTGRILIPLAQDGHELVGLDKSKAMLDRARTKIAQLPDELQRRITLIEADVTTDDWPKGFDVVILGGNWPYELPTAEVQEGCIESAAASLKPGGYVFHDSDHMEGELDGSWREPGIHKRPEQLLPDGTRIQGTSETIWYDAPRRLWRARRTTTVTFPDGKTLRKEHIQQKHPVSQAEVRGWLDAHGFKIEYAKETPERIIYWAKRAARPDIAALPDRRSLQDG